MPRPCACWRVLRAANALRTEGLSLTRAAEAVGGVEGRRHLREQRPGAVDHDVTVRSTTAPTGSDAADVVEPREPSVAR